MVPEQLYNTTVIVKDFYPRTLNTYEADDADMLSQHPYITRTVAIAIVAYREQHGKFTSLDQLSAAKVIEQASLNKLKVYLDL